MTIHKRSLSLDDFDDLDIIPRIRNMQPPRKSNARKPRASKRSRAVREEAMSEVNEQAESMDSLNFSYHASRYESTWLLESLHAFYDQQWFEDILRLVKGGKEASVYLCRARPNLNRPFLAAKVYRPRQFRNLKNDHLYREGRAQLDADGREITDDGMLHAIQKRTYYGQALMHTAWLAQEYTTLQALHAAGLDVPQPYASGENVILMEYIGDEDTPAPTLNSLSLSPDEAVPLFKRVVWNIDRMLELHYVHGDLSAYNLLYWEGQVKLIDFPQAIDPDVNRSAYLIFERDVIRVCEYFSHFGVRTNPRRLAADLWQSHGYRFMPEVHPRLLDDQDDRDVEYWLRLAERGK